jgi:hypothetical protein
MFSTPKSENELKMQIVATRRNFQIQPKILKRISEHQNENFPQKSIFSLIFAGTKTLRRGYQTLWKLQETLT